MSKPRILIQLDSDTQASVFDAVTAIDSNLDHLLQYAAVKPEQVQNLVHGAMFTRGPDDLHRTALFIGGSDVTAGEQLLRKATECFFGPIRVSVMLDANGANTTAAAAVLSASQHVELNGSTALVLGGTGPVGLRAARLLASTGGKVRVASRSQERATAACEALAGHAAAEMFQPVAVNGPEQLEAAMEGVTIVIAAGAAGAELIPEGMLARCESLKVAIDLNAVPPAGIADIKSTARAEEVEGVVCYGAIGVGGLKMKIHRKAIKSLFLANDRVLDAEEIFEIGREIIQ